MAWTSGKNGDAEGGRPMTPEPLFNAPRERGVDRRVARRAGHADFRELTCDQGGDASIGDSYVSDGCW